MSWQINPATGDYVMTNGKPTESDSLIYPAYYRTKTPRLKWLHAPDDKWGSDFSGVNKRFNGRDLNGLANIQAQALQPMIDDGRALAVRVTFDSSQQTLRNNASLNAAITSAEGVTQNLNLPAVGD